MVGDSSYLTSKGARRKAKIDLEYFLLALISSLMYGKLRMVYFAIIKNVPEKPIFLYFNIYFLHT